MFFYLTPYEVDFTCELLHNVTKRWKFVAKKEKKSWAKALKSLKVQEHPSFLSRSANSPVKRYLKTSAFFNWLFTSQRPQTTCHRYQTPKAHHEIGNTTQCRWNTCADRPQGFLNASRVGCVGHILVFNIQFYKGCTKLQFCIRVGNSFFPQLPFLRGQDGISQIMLNGKHSPNTSS